MGWKIVGSLSKRKCSSWLCHIQSAHDFFFIWNYFTRGITGLEMNFVGKKELFRFPLGGYFRYMGGEPLDRAGGFKQSRRYCCYIYKETR
jgi:hypothetical protein